LVVVSSKFVYHLPEEMSFQDAVAMTMNFTVAYYLLFELSNLQPGQTILIHSVGGGVVSYHLISSILA
jgi:NADPH:quinone reductase